LRIEDNSVLSINKLVAAGQAKYYLDQVEGRVDAVQSIGDGVEEYYLGGTEARGQWMGTGACGLELVGPVAGEHLRGVLEGRGKNGLALRDSACALRVAGYDLTYSASKSVSVLFGLGDPVLVANLGRGPDARWTALDGRHLYAQARTTSFIYQAVLRSELTQSLGVEWLTVRDGIAEIAGVPKPVMRAFSRGRVDIEAELARHGTSGARAAEAAALATRQAKDRRTDIATLTVSWRARAEELGFGLSELSRMLGHRRRGRAFAEADRERLFDALAAPTGLTRGQATFNRRGVIQALCEQLPADHAIDAGSLEALADRFLARRASSHCYPRMRPGRRMSHSGDATDACFPSRARSGPTRRRSCLCSSDASWIPRCIAATAESARRRTPPWAAPSPHDRR